MPVIKNAIARYYIINECLTNERKPYWTMEELLQQVAERDIQVSKRSLEMDLQSMRYDERLGYNAPIEYSKKHKGFHYTEPGYSIDKLPLSEIDMETFEILLESFQRFKGAQVLNQVEGMFDKLGKVIEQLKPRKSKIPYPVVAFEKIPYYKGIEHFDKLYQAILKQQPLNISYQKFEEDTTKEHIFHPYLLKEYKNRWYLLGYSEKRKGKLILGLDRIEKISNAKIAFKPYKGIEVQKFFDHTIGVTINNSPVKEIRLWFSKAQGNYIKTQHLHATQQIISDNDTGLIVTLQLIPNYELIQTLLSFGAEVKVLEPTTLRHEIEDTLKRTLDLYKK